MKHIKFIIAAVLLAVVVTACDGDKQQREQQVANLTNVNQSLVDSLARANAEKDTLLALMTEIGDGLVKIKDMQQIVASSDLSRETSSQKQQLRNDMRLIQQSIAEKQQRWSSASRAARTTTSNSSATSRASRPNLPTSRRLSPRSPHSWPKPRPTSPTCVAMSTACAWPTRR